MKKIIYIFCFSLISSCNYFEEKKIKISDELIQEKLIELDLTSIDKYPIFKECESLSGNTEDEKDCFVHFFSTFVSNELSKHNLILSEEIQETIYIPIIISQEGEVVIKPFVIPDSVQLAIPNIKKLLIESISKLPKIVPGYKIIKETGELIPVTTKFMIPIKVSE